MKYLNLLDLKIRMVKEKGYWRSIGLAKLKLGKNEDNAYVINYFGSMGIILESIKDPYSFKFKTKLDETAAFALFGSIHEY